MRVRALAAAQSVSRPGDIDANLAHHATLARAAASAGAEVVVFPELSLTGYELDLARDLAFAEDDARLDPVVELARECEATLIVGAPVRLDARLHIGAFIVYADGTVELYTKRYLGAGEGTCVEAGGRDPLVRLADGPAAVAVCADANRPEHPRDAAARGARTYLVSSLIEPGVLERKTGVLRAYAAEHAMTVVFANHGAASGGLETGGRSAIWSAAGEPLAQLDGPGPGVVVAVETGGGWRGRSIPG